MSNWTTNEKRIDISYGHKHSYVCVEYPGKVENVDKALETIGGNRNVTKNYNNPAKRLPLIFRPDDIYCKPMYGDRIAVTNLLMKVKKRKRKSDGRVEYSVQILGTVETFYKFQGMCDFQYMPMKKLPDGSYESILDRIQISTLSDRQEYLTRDAPLFIPPLSFSRVDRPVDFLYRQSIEHRGQYKNPDISRPPNLIGTVRQRRSIHTIFVNFGEAIPTTPIPEAKKRLTADFVDPLGEQTLKKLLEEKPLWLKVELQHRTGYRGEKLKTFLPALCFYWLDGPWRAQWNKIGYDPTKDVGAKIYQTIDFRIRQAKPGQQVVKAKRTDLHVTQWNTTTRNQKHNVKIDLSALGDDSKTGKKKANAPEVDKEIYYKFKPDKVPPHRLMYYPACYVEIDEVQYLVHQNDRKERGCNEKDGWCVPDFNERAREHMYKYVNRLLQQDDNIEMRFWRSKKVKRRNEMLRLQCSDDEEEDSSRSGQGTSIMDNTYGEGTSQSGLETSVMDSTYSEGTIQSGMGTSIMDSTYGEGTSQSGLGTSVMDNSENQETSISNNACVGGVNVEATNSLGQGATNTDNKDTDGAISIGQGIFITDNTDMGQIGSLGPDTSITGNADMEGTGPLGSGNGITDNTAMEGTSVLEQGTSITDNADIEMESVSETSGVHTRTTDVEQEHRHAEPGTSVCDDGGSTDQLVPEMPSMQDSTVDAH